MMPRASTHCAITAQRAQRAAPEQRELQQEKARHSGGGSLEKSHQSRTPVHGPCGRIGRAQVRVLHARVVSGERWKSRKGVPDAALRSLPFQADLAKPGFFVTRLTVCG